MRDTAGQLTERFHFLEVAQALFGMAALLHLMLESDIGLAQLLGALPHRLFEIVDTGRLGQRQPAGEHALVASPMGEPERGDHRRQQPQPDNAIAVVQPIDARIGAVHLRIMAAALALLLRHHALQLLRNGAHGCFLARRLKLAESAQRLIIAHPHRNLGQRVTALGHRRAQPRDRRGLLGVGAGGALQRDELAQGGRPLILKLAADTGIMAHHIASEQRFGIADLGFHRARLKHHQIAVPLERDRALALRGGMIGKVEEQAERQREDSREPNRHEKRRQRGVSSAILGEVVGVVCHVDGRSSRRR